MISLGLTASLSAANFSILSRAALHTAQSS